MPSGPALTFEAPEEMAKKLTYNYLEKLYQFIKSGEIYGVFGHLPLPSQASQLSNAKGIWE